MYEHRRHLSRLAIVIILALIVLHASKWHRVRVDGITLGLIGLAVLIPYLDYIRKLKLGEFEAEIAPQEVKEVRDKTAGELPPPSEMSNEQADEYESILDAVRQEPAMGLFKIRFELENLLRTLVSQTVPNPRRVAGLTQLVRMLRDANSLPPELADSISEIAPLLNRATHGEYIRSADAEELARVGIRVLQELREQVRKRTLVPSRSEVIDQERIDDYSRARYRVTTIIPYVENPKRNEYLLNQQQLDYFLDTYGEYAEFLIGVERLREG